jgi:hypothetical protein
MRPRGSTAPTSRRARLSRLLRAERRAYPDGITFAEIVRAYAAAYPRERADHDALTSAVGAMIHAGELVRAGDADDQRYEIQGTRGGPQASQLAERDRTIGATVARVVAAHYAAERCPITTAAIREALQRAHAWPDRWPGLFNLLLGLTRPGALSAHVNAHVNGHTAGPVLRRASAAPGAAGLAYAFWLPADAPDQCATAPATPGDALRRAVGAASIALRRPVSMREVRLWLHVQPATSPFRALLSPQRIAKRLRGTLAHDAARAGTAGRLHAVMTALTCHGGAPTRYLTRPPTPCDRLACDVADLLDALRPERELASIRHLRGEACASSPAVQCLLALRRRALVETLHTAGNLHEIGRVLDRLRRGARVVAAWSAAGSGYASAQGRRELALSTERFDAAAGVLAFARCDAMHAPRRQNSRGADPPRRVGEAALVAPRTSTALVRTAIARGEFRVARPEAIYASARRFPSRSERVERALVRGDELALLDRVDCVAALAQRAVPGGVATLVRDAQSLLGEVLRDERTVRRALRDIASRERQSYGADAHGAPIGAHPHDAWLRRSLVVALGLLGARVKPELALGDARDQADVRALLVSTVLASARAHDAVPLVCALRDATSGPARHLVERTAARLRAGYLFTSVE